MDIRGDSTYVYYLRDREKKRFVRKKQRNIQGHRLLEIRPQSLPTRPSVWANPELSIYRVTSASASLILLYNKMVPLNTAKDEKQGSRSRLVKEIRLDFVAVLDFT